MDYHTDLRPERPCSGYFPVGRTSWRLRTPRRFHESSRQGTSPPKLSRPTRRGRRAEPRPRGSPATSPSSSPCRPGANARRRASPTLRLSEGRAPRNRDRCEGATTLSQRAQGGRRACGTRNWARDCCGASPTARLQATSDSKAEAVIDDAGPGAVNTTMNIMRCQERSALCRSAPSFTTNLRTMTLCPRSAS